MGSSGNNKKSGKKKVRVAFRQNRSKRRRKKDWSEQAAHDDNEVDAAAQEGIRAKGDLSRHRTIIVNDEVESRAEDMNAGVVVAMRGLFAEVDDGQRVWNCTVRRVLRTRLIEERHPVTIGDRVRFTLDESGDEAVREGVIEVVDPRHGHLRRKVGRRIQTIVANVDQAIIVTCAAEPAPKPNLIDRYIVAASAGGIAPIVCMNKTDLDDDGNAATLISRYRDLGIKTVETSAVTGAGIECFRSICQGRATVVAGQSGVGKSSLLNALQPGLSLRVGRVGTQNQKGRHTTTTAELLKLDIGGYVVDTPGIRSFDLTMIPRHEYEAHFVEFVKHVADCKFPDCTHTHETDCALKRAVEDGHVHPDRYRSYVQMFEDPGLMD
ncbi:MAG: ribosome small subunit-dependent GTPase A [Planctomycetota bacterium]|jgi:ribosome biogenesis GTPase